ncbi:hypothetical protein [Halorarum salinum]|uniref:Uncharacterized protein n=1 Tax=Halorarum salinum TaxID=2743089 RepID=A0A7D5L9T9_9EURY|nr:hypothetical protein [Halobaculum salinum]QLG61706.1 hypothetical protein HUG12_08185 [Halobaculum salinum]
MTSKALSRRTMSTLAKRFRTTAAYSRRQPSTGWAADANGDQLKLSAMAAAAA